MKILFLVYHGLSSSSGITKKIIAQIDGLTSSGNDVSLCYYTPISDGRRVWKVNDKIIKDYGRGKWAKIRSRMELGCIVDYCTKNAIEVVYVRSFHNANPITINLFRQLRKHGITILMEIPTYPYDHEYKDHSRMWKMALCLDKLYRHKLASCCHSIITFTDHKTIFGQKTIRISNGIDLKQFQLRRDRKKVILGKHRAMHIIMVAEIHYWHGVDRLLKGVGEYLKHNPAIDLVIHIVGPLDACILNGTEEYEGIKPIIARYGIARNVELHGALFGNQLDEVFDMCDFAIGSLARHRSGITTIKTLKNREYAARGFQFAYSETDTDFDSAPYVFKVPADESLVNMEQIVRFYLENDVEPEDIRRSISHLTWERQMQTVINECVNAR